MFDMKNEEDFQATISMLKDRTLRTFKIAHVLLDNEIYYCLDFDLSAKSLSELSEMIRLKISSAAVDDIVTPKIINEDQWRLFVNGETIPPLTLIEAPKAGRKGVVIVAVRRPNAH